MRDERSASSSPRRPGARPPKLLRRSVALRVCIGAAAISLVLPPHTVQSKANELLLFYGFGGIAGISVLLSRRIRKGRLALWLLTAVALSSPGFFGIPITVGPVVQTALAAPSLGYRLLQLSAVTGLGLLSLLLIRILLALVANVRIWRWWRFGRRGSFAYAASCVALGLSALGSAHTSTTIVVWVLIGCSAMWAVVPCAHRQADLRPVALAITSVGGLLGAVLLFLRAIHGAAFDPFSTAGLVGFAVFFSAIAAGCAGLAVLLSVTLGRLADTVGGLFARFAVLSLCVVGLVATVHAHQTWPIRIEPGTGHGDGQFSAGLDLPLIVMMTGVLIRGLAGELRSARRRFLRIAAGTSGDDGSTVGRAETGDLLRSISRFSARLRQRTFLESLSSELQGRTEELRTAIRELELTTVRLVETEGFAATAELVGTVGRHLRGPVQGIREVLPIIRASVSSAAELLRLLPIDAERLADRLAAIAADLKRAAVVLEQDAHRALSTLSGLGDNATSIGSPVEANGATLAIPPDQFTH